MSPEEIELIVSRAVKEGFQFPWWLYLSAIFATFIGGFLGAYLKRKGENRAANENFDSLLKQIKKTTTETESIKSELAKGSWLHQQSWNLKEKYYSGLLEALYRLRHSVSVRLDHYNEQGSEHDDARINESDHYIKHAKSGVETLQKIQELHGPAEMVISDRSIEALNKFYSAGWHAENFSSCNKEYLVEVFVSVDETYKVILEEAQIALK